MISLDKKSNIPLYTQLYNQLRKGIINGELKVDGKLTAIRVMAEDLGISKNTVETAYKQLLSEGFIRAEIGSGYYVEDVCSDFIFQGKGKGKNEIKNDREKMKYDFRYSSIEVSNFPWKKWKHYVGEAIADMEYRDYVSYESCKGNGELRENLKKFLHDNRGVQCETKQILVCSGTQHGAEMIINMLGGKGLNVAFEEPGFYTTRNIFTNSGCNVSPVTVTETGIDMEELKRSQAKIVYVTPSRQMPTGRVMTKEERMELLHWAEENKAYIFEDDYDSEFRYGSIPVPSIQSMDTNDRVIYAGTFSKILLPSFRMAYIILPKRLLRLFEKKYKYFNSFLPTSHQIATAKFLKDGSLERHMRRMVKLNQDKCEILIKGLKNYLGDYMEPYGRPGGTHILVKIHHVGEEDAVLKKLKEKSVKIYGTKQFFLNKERAIDSLFMIGFNSINTNMIEEGCKAIAEALELYPDKK